MISKQFVWCFLLAAFAICIQATPNVTVIADGFTWVENLALDGQGNLFVSDRVQGEIFRIYLNSTSGVYEKQLWFSGLHRVLGLTIDPSKPWLMYAAGKDSSKKNVVISLDTTIPNTSTTLISDLGSGTGNGLGIHFQTGLVYTSTEGEEIIKSVKSAFPNFPKGTRRQSPPDTTVMQDMQDYFEVIVDIASYFGVNIDLEKNTFSDKKVEEQTVACSEGESIWSFIHNEDIAGLKALVTLKPESMEERGPVGEIPLHLCFLYGGPKQLEMGYMESKKIGTKKA